MSLLFRLFSLFILFFPVQKWTSLCLLHIAIRNIGFFIVHMTRYAVDLLQREWTNESPAEKSIRKASCSHHIGNLSLYFRSSSHWEKMLLISKKEPAGRHQDQKTHGLHPGRETDLVSSQGRDLRNRLTDCFLITGNKRETEKKLSDVFLSGVTPCSIVMETPIDLTGVSWFYLCGILCSASKYGRNVWVDNSGHIKVFSFGSTSCRR